MSDDKPTLEERENGPLIGKRIPRLVGEDGTEMETKAIMPLCRCGLSASKPFCDGSHRDADFKSRADGQIDSDDLLSFDCAEVATFKDGPLMITEPGEDGTKQYLCRCGHSKNKPFCDGSHKKVGWSSAN